MGLGFRPWRVAEQRANVVDRVPGVFRLRIIGFFTGFGFRVFVVVAVALVAAEGGKGAANV